jgi:hypothetical protein
MVTILSDGGATEVAGASGSGGALWVPLDAVEQATGWRLKPEGLCFGDVCVPVRDTVDLVAGSGLDADEFARLTGRVAVVDAARGIVAMTESGNRRSEGLATLVAADFTLPDIDGNPVSLHDFDRRKRLLLAWSSW